jgi:hypothetical protein
MTCLKLPLQFGEHPGKGIPAPSNSHLSEWLIDKIFRDSSETVWRQEGKAVTIQMDSLVPDLTKVTKAERF